MKALLVYVLLSVLFFVETKNKNAYSLVKPSVKSFSNDSIPSDTGLIDFNSNIEPIFASHCSPCHFKGGKMYERLPFDKDATIIAHEEGILRRIKDETESELIKQYIQQQVK